MKEQKRTVGVPMRTKDIAKLEKIGKRNQRKLATEARVAILNHIEREELK